MAFRALGPSQLFALLLRSRASRAAIGIRPNGIVLLQQIREGWSGQDGFEGEDHLEDFHHSRTQDSAEDDGHFDLIETTVSHLFREPNERLNGLTYGRLLMQQLRRLGWFTPKAAHHRRSGRRTRLPRPGIRQGTPALREAKHQILLGRHHPTLPQATSYPRNGGRLALQRHTSEWRMAALQG